MAKISWNQKCMRKKTWLLLQFHYFPSIWRTSQITAVATCQCVIWHTSDIHHLQSADAVTSMATKTHNLWGFNDSFCRHYCTPNITEMQYSGMISNRYRSIAKHSFHFWNALTHTHTHTHCPTHFYCRLSNTCTFNWTAIKRNNIYNSDLPIWNIGGNTIM